MEQQTPRGLKNRLRRMKTWLHAHPTAAYALVGVGLIIAAILTAFAILWQKPEPIESPDIVVKPKVIPKYYSPLTGELVKNEAATTKPTTAIMLENSPDARPQSGLKEAEVVYEAVAEGGITRFLALYQQDKPKLVGPVRSLRLYYVDWLTPYNASVAHIGGSKKALDLVRNGKYRDIDQFFNPNTYWRATDRYAPHNVYTNFSKLSALNKSKGYKSSKPKPFARSDTTPVKKLNAKRVSIHISGPSYDSVYRYSIKSKRYARSQGGAPHLDREKGQITARVVIALRVSMEQVFEDGYRESIKTTGRGSAMIFQDGKAHKVTWKKTSRAAQLTFTDSKGEPFELARGTTWISAIPTSTGSVSWK